MKKSRTMRRRDLLAEYGWNYAMIDVGVSGTIAPIRVLRPFPPGDARCI